MDDNHELQPLPGDERDEMPSIDDGFRIVDEVSANWVVRKITESRRYADRVRAWGAVEIRRAERDEQFFLNRFAQDLEVWCLQQIAGNGGRRRSLNLPAGSIGFRTCRATLHIVNNTELLAWCRANLPDAIEVIERVAKTPLQVFLEANGELPAGVEFVPRGDRFYVERSSTG